MSKKYVRKKGNLKRKRPYRNPINIKKILIITEGELEKSYFKAINSYYKNTVLEIETVCSSFGTDMINIVRFAINEKRKYNLDELESIWCVFDTDKGNNTLENLNEALSLAYRNKIKIAISNPSFEVWLLMHYTRSSANIYNGQKAKTLLTAKIPNYDSVKNFFQLNKNTFNELIEFLSEAITNSENVDKEHDRSYQQRYEKEVYLMEYDFRRNRSTHIYKLMREIKNLIEKKQLHQL